MLRILALAVCRIGVVCCLPAPARQPFLYPATQKVAGYYVIPSENFEILSVCPSVRPSVRPHLALSHSFKSLFLSVHTHGIMRHAEKVIKQRHNSVIYYGINIQKSFIQFANISMNLTKPAGEVTTILRQSAKSPAAIGSNAE